MNNRDVSLQINLSAGDADYCTKTVPPLLMADNPIIKERFLVIDCNRPQKTPIVDPDLRFPKETFLKRLNQVQSFAQELLDLRQVDRVFTLEPGDPISDEISQEYLRGLTRATHDYGGCALMAYLAAFKLCNTRFILHFDADMFIHQETDWVTTGRDYLIKNTLCAAVTPRISPPDELLTTPTHSLWPEVIGSDPSGWHDHWFSTRCYLFDIQKLMQALPLLTGWPWYRAILRRFFNRGFPPSPEAMLSHRLRAQGLYHLQLSDTRVWLLHPKEKDELFLNLLDAILPHIEEGNFPKLQAGIADLNLNAWASFINDKEGLS